MRRWLFRILICIALGFLSTIALAWLGAVLAQVAEDREVTTRGMWQLRQGESVEQFRGFAWRLADRAQENNWSFRRERRFAAERIVLRNPSYPPRVAPPPPDFIPSWSRFSRRDAEWVTSSESFAVLEDRAFGWPIRALSQHGVTVLHGSKLPEANEGASFHIPAKRFGDWQSMNIALPVEPIPLGIALNVLVLASMWFVFFYVIGFRIFGPTLTTMIIWRLRKRCPKCGYDPRGNVAEGCPECGWRRE